MAKRLYIGNLPYETTESELRTLFSEAGQVEDVKIIFDAYSGRSKGFGFVEMRTEENANVAKARFDQTVVGGRTIKVADAKPRPNYTSRRNDGYAPFYR